MFGFVIFWNWLLVERYLKDWKVGQQSKSFIPGKNHNYMYFSGLEILVGYDNRLKACQPVGSELAV